MDMKEVQELADELIGTCNALPDWVLDSVEFCKDLDELVMRCECCSWWVEPCEMNEDQICQNCAEE